MICLTVSTLPDFGSVSANMSTYMQLGRTPLSEQCTRVVEL